MPLPVDPIRSEFLKAAEKGAVVLTAPTGTGKSTQVPRWLPGRVLVVQPRRVACRAVASRIAELEGAALGQTIGYRVRDDSQCSSETRVLLVTPGIVLSDPGLLDRFDIVVLDEFHERRLDTDLILAFLLERQQPLVVMSATLDAERVAEHVRGQHLSVSARSYPVDIQYSSQDDALPSIRGLERRVRAAVNQLTPLSGSVRVFVPGKNEIGSVVRELEAAGIPALPLHGGLSLKHQARALKQSEQARVIVTTNVAETSVTVPGVRAVIDSGLVRRTAYYAGRSFLSLASVALDSAEQRAGRAGRTAPGICIRLWGEHAVLESATPPEIHRESLVPLVLTSASLHLLAEELPFLDPPKPYALADARLGISNCQISG